MKFSKRQKMCVAILAVAAAGLLIDRALLSPGTTGPKKIIAAEVRPLAEASPAATVRAEEPPKRHLVERLEAMSKSPDLHLPDVQDAFSLSDAWMAEFRSKAAPDAELSPAEKFAKSHQLMAIVVSGMFSTATIDDTCLAIDQELDGFKLVSVDERSAVLQSGDQRVVLKLKERNFGGKLFIQENLPETPILPSQQ